MRSPLCFWAAQTSTVFILHTNFVTRRAHRNGRLAMRHIQRNAHLLIDIAVDLLCMPSCLCTILHPKLEETGTQLTWLPEESCWQVGAQLLEWRGVGSSQLLHWTLPWCMRMFDFGVFFCPDAFENAPGYAWKWGAQRPIERKTPIVTMFRGSSERSSYCKRCEKYATSSWGNMLTMRHLATAISVCHPCDIFFWSVFRPRRRRCSVSLCLHALNACITTDGGSEARHLTPPIGSSPLWFKSPRFLGLRTMSRGTPYKMCHRVVSAPPLSSGSRENHGPNEESGDGNRTVTQMCWTSVGKLQFFFRAMRTYLLERQSSTFFYFLRPRPRSSMSAGEGQKSGCNNVW